MTDEVQKMWKRHDATRKNITDQTDSLPEAAKLFIKEWSEVVRLAGRLGPKASSLLEEAAFVADVVVMVKQLTSPPEKVAGTPTKGLGV